METTPEFESSQQGCSASPPVNKVESEDQRQEISPFLGFIGLIRRFQIPIVDQCIADPQQRAEAAVSILGKGGQYIVDRTYSNQRYGIVRYLALNILRVSRYPGRKGLVAESNTVYKRIIWSTQSQTPDSIQHESQLRAFVNEVKVLGCLRWSPYVVKLIGIAWEHDTHTQLSPVLALEYAQHNSLSRFLADDSGNTITFREKKKLISNVTGGIHHLHDADFVWGDCKP
jgi:serine/threonine protein kinase